MGVLAPPPPPLWGCLDGAAGVSASLEDIYWANSPCQVGIRTWGADPPSPQLQQVIARALGVPLPVARGGACAGIYPSPCRDQGQLDFFFMF